MKSFRTRVFLIFTLPVILIIVAGNVLLTWQISKYQKKLEEKEFLGIANTISTLIEIDHFEPLSSYVAGSEEKKFAGLERKLRKIMDDIQSLRSISILVKKDERSFYVIAGADSKYEREQALLSGMSYPIENFPGSLMGFAVPFVLRDGSGFLTGYIPVRDARGMSVALLRLRYDPSGNLKSHRIVYFEVLGITIFLILLSVLFGFFISHQIAVPVNNLVEGIESIRSGNLDFRLKVEGDDEFGKLARTFNKMADGLIASRKILRSYLYRTVRSIVSILEARDPYTRGHS
ncbi:MAG: HAMP domain-containing protein, partial [Candidatus Omnitrophica bacterium]|nr:HAMP domain-containing protein [Candidatus Omnitrophota bacterium]